jgi:RNA polymerase sigma-70 factor (ECF subfamily)
MGTHAGKMATLERLVESYQARLRSYAYSRTGSTDAADDIVQEVFLVVFRQLDRYDASRPAWPWLMGIARIALQEYWRARARDTHAERLQTLAALQQLERDEHAPAEPDWQARLEQLRLCQEKLPQKSKELVGLIYGQRLSCEEVAARWSTGAGAVRVAIHRIRKALRTCVESQLAGGLT